MPKKQKMLLPSPSWLRANGYAEAVKAMKRSPELFAHIPQEKDPPKKRK